MGRLHRFKGQGHKQHFFQNALLRWSRWRPSGFVLVIAHILILKSCTRLTSWLFVSFLSHSSLHQYTGMLNTWISYRMTSQSYRLKQQAWYRKHWCLCLSLKPRPYLLIISNTTIKSHHYSRPQPQPIICTSSSQFTRDYKTLLQYSDKTCQWPRPILYKTRTTLAINCTHSM